MTAHLFWATVSSSASLLLGGLKALNTAAGNIEENREAFQHVVTTVTVEM